MARRQLVLPQDSMTPEERREKASAAASARWRRGEHRHYRQLAQIGESAVKAHTGLRQEIAALQSTRAVEMAHHLRRLIAAFHNLWRFGGHDLPKDLQDYAAGVVDELQRVEKARGRQP